MIFLKKTELKNRIVMDQSVQMISTAACILAGRLRETKQIIHRYFCAEGSDTIEETCAVILL